MNVMTVADGEQTRVEAFVHAQGQGLLGLALALTGNRPDAEDLWQDTFADVIRNWDKVRAAAAPTAYVRAMMTRRHISNHRRLWRSERPTPHLELGAGSLPVPDPTAAVEGRDRLLSLVAGLPARTRAVLVLRYAEDLDDATIAEILGITSGTVRSLASRGLATLREKEQS